MECTKHFSLTNTNREVVKLPLKPIKGSPFYGVDVQIENNFFFLQVCLGNKGYGSLVSQSMEKIKNKKRGNTETWHDINGKAYHDKVFSVDAVVIDGKTFPNVDFSEYQKKINQAQLDGSLNINFFRLNQFCVVDVPRKFLYFFKNKEDFFEDFRLPLSRFLEIDMKSPDNRLIIDADTDFGRKRLDFSTELSESYLVPTDEKWQLNQKVTFRKFSINNELFTPQSFRLVSFPSHVKEYDGILGMDFFKKHIIFFDFKENKVYIGPNEIDQKVELEILND